MKRWPKDRASLKKKSGVRLLNPNLKRWRLALKGHTDSAHGGKIKAGCAACAELSARAENGGEP
jgi:hypothetical protein